MKNRFMAIIVAMLLIVSVFSLPLNHSLSAETASDWVVPEGYNENDYNKVVSFLEQTNEDGVKNGTLLSEDYDSNDPTTWGEYWGWADGSDEPVNLSRFEWTDSNGELRLFRVEIHGMFILTGVLDLSGCDKLMRMDCSENALTDLILTGCNSLEILQCHSNALTTLDVSSNHALRILGCPFNSISEIDVSACTELTTLECGYNNLETLNVTNNPQLTMLSCDGNPLTSLDLSYNPLLYELWCSGTQLTELDLSTNPLLFLDHIRSEGNGTIGYFYTSIDDFGVVMADACDGSNFIGWYSEDGELLTENAYPTVDSFGEQTVIVARFAESVPIAPGDIDANGEVSVADALLAMRCAMGILELTPNQQSAGDMDGNGTIEIDDALLIMRLARGLIEL